MSTLYLQTRFVSLLRIGLSSILGLVFLYAGLLKVADPLKFADAIYAFQLLPRPCLIPLALGLPMIEILSGILLITGWQRRIGALAILCLSIVFAIAIASALARGLVINCSCFGEAGVPTRFKLWYALSRDLVLMIAASSIYWSESISPKSNVPHDKLKEAA